MRGSKAKALRKGIYDGVDFRDRRYFVHRDNPRTVLADYLRGLYQKGKRLCRGIKNKEIPAQARQAVLNWEKNLSSLDQEAQ